MKRTFSSALAAAGLCAAMSLTACGTTEAAGGDGATQDAAVTGTDAAISDTGPADAVGDTGPKTDSTVADVPAADVPAAAKCTPVCGATEFCDVTGATPKCVAITCTLPSKWGTAGDGAIQKMSIIAVSGKDKDGKMQGCDLDGDGVPNNVLGKVIDLYKDLNKVLAEKVGDGTVILILEAPEFKADNSPFDFNVLIGDKDEANLACDVTSAAANCGYTVSKLSYDVEAKSGNCPAKITFPASKLTKEGALTAGGKNQKFVINIPVVGLNLKLTISQAQITGIVSDATSWKNTKSGRLCGVISKDDLNGAIDALPDDALKAIGDKATVKALVGSILKPDITLEGSDKPDAISVSLDFETIGGKISGVTAK